MRISPGPSGDPFPVLLCFAGAIAVGCGDSDGAGERDAAPAAPSVTALDDIGYATVSEVRHPDVRSGVVHRDPERSSPGYDLYTDRYRCTTTLIDGEGNPVARWSRPRDRCWSNAQLLPDGDLLVIGWERGPTYHGAIDEHRYLLRLTWSGEERWKRTINAHHDLEVTGDGRIAVLAFRCVPLEASEPETILREDLVCLLGEDGEEIDCRPLGPALEADREAYPVEAFAPSRIGEVRYLDPVHANSVEFMHDPGLEGRHPLYAAGNVLVSMRHQDAIMVVRFETGELVWSWGRDELEGPHDATVLESGHLLVFDNGLRRGWSRVIELDPLAREIVWQYRASPPESFYSASRGSSQRLPGGNTLICESDAGRAFEVTPEGVIVWSWLNPARDEEGRLATLVRMKRLPPEYVAPLLD